MVLGLPDLRTLSDTDLDALYEAVAAERSARSVRESARMRALAIAEEYEAQASPEAKDIKALAEGAIVGPGERVIVGGTTWRNTSKTWLDPFTSGPVNYPAGWTKN